MSMFLLMELCDRQDLRCMTVHIGRLCCLRNLAGHATEQTALVITVKSELSLLPNSAKFYHRTLRNICVEQTLIYYLILVHKEIHLNLIFLLKWEYMCFMLNSWQNILKKPVKPHHSRSTLDEQFVISLSYKLGEFKLLDLTLTCLTWYFSLTRPLIFRLVWNHISILVIAYRP